MIIKPILGGMFESISYLVGDNGKAILIDAGVPSAKVIAAAKESNLQIEKIILTHGHIDHIAELKNIAEVTNAKVYIHVDDEMALTDPRYNASHFTGNAFTFDLGFESLKDKSSFELGSLEFEIIHTPGHTPGSICIYVKNTLFSGDTLFNLGYGRVDLMNGNFEDIYNSIVEKLFKLPDDTVVYPGHADSTTIGKEKRFNPIRQATTW